MKLEITVSPQSANQQKFLAVLLRPQVIVTNRQAVVDYAVFLTNLLGLPVVLVGQGTGDFWQSYGETHFAHRLDEIGLAQLLWRRVELDIPNF